MANKRLTLKDVLMRDQVSRDVVNRGKILDDYTRKIMDERSNRKPDLYTGKKYKVDRSKKEKNLLKDAIRIGNRPSASGVKLPRIGTNKIK